MKKKLLTGLFALLTVGMCNEVCAQTWDFTKGFSEETLAGLNYDYYYWGCWNYSSDTRYTLQCDKSTLSYYSSNGTQVAIKETDGLLFTGGNSGYIYIEHSLNRPSIKFNSTTPTVTIPGLVNGTEITIVTKTGNSSSERGITCTSGNATRVSGAEVSLDEITNVFVVTCEEGKTADVTFKPYVGGINIYSIVAEDITTIEKAMERLTVKRLSVDAVLAELDTLGLSGVLAELKLLYENTSVDETSIESVKAEIVRLNGILMKIDEGKSIYTQLPVLIEECEMLLEGKPWEKMTESLASVKSLMDNSANVNTDEFVSAYETLKNIKSSLSLLNTFVSRTDVDILLTNDEKYPWKILDGYLQNGNTGIDYSASSLTIAYSSVYKTEISFDWLCHDYYDNNLSVFIDGVLKSSTTNSSYTNQRFYLEPGEHLIMFQDTIRDTYSTNDYSYIKNLSIKEIKPLETVVLSMNSDSITFENNGAYPWTIEDGYIQSSNYGYANTTSKFSTTFTVEEPSKFSFEVSVSFPSYSENSNKFTMNVNGEKYYNYSSPWTSSSSSTGWMKRNVLLEPGKYTIEFLDSVCNSNTYNLSRIRNIELSSNWVEVELASAGTLGVEVLYKVNVLNDVELLKVKGTLNGTDWTNIKQMKNLVGLDLTEASFNAVPDYGFDGLTYLSSVKLPEGMTSIGEYAFRGTQIWNIDIPSTVTSIGQYAFANTRLRSIDFPENSQLKTIGYSAFYQCTSLKEFIMPNTVTTLQRYNNYSDTLIVFRSPKQPKLFRNNQI
ncbi:MAG: leucine-rich repeat domain-containing protein [Bacteroidaceae bacterium]|nr:leucine-rich repeat domain-containing protein [Bacteroidaceae bacterium]